MKPFESNLLVILIAVKYVECIEYLSPYLQPSRSIYDVFWTVANLMNARTPPSIWISYTLCDTSFPCEYASKLNSIASIWCWVVLWCRSSQTVVGSRSRVTLWSTDGWTGHISSMCAWSPISSSSLSRVNSLQLSWGVSVSVFIVWSGLKYHLVMLATVTNSNPSWLQSLSCSEIVWRRGSNDWESVNYASVVGAILKCLCESVKAASGRRSWCKVLECCWSYHFISAPLSSSSLYRYG